MFGMLWIEDFNFKWFLDRNGVLMWIEIARRGDLTSKNVRKLLILAGG